MIHQWERKGFAPKSIQVYDSTAPSPEHLVVRVPPPPAPSYLLPPKQGSVGGRDSGWLLIWPGRWPESLRRTNRWDQEPPSRSTGELDFESANVNASGSGAEKGAGESTSVASGSTLKTAVPSPYTHTQPKKGILEDMSKYKIAKRLWSPVQEGRPSVTQKAGRSEAGLGGPVHSKPEGELLGCLVKQLWVLCQLLRELQPNGLSRLRLIHQHVEGLQDWGEKSNQDIRRERKNSWEGSDAAHSRIPLKPTPTHA